MKRKDRKKWSLSFVMHITVAVILLFSSCAKKEVIRRIPPPQEVEKLGEEKKETGLAAEILEAEKRLPPDNPVALFNLANKKRRLGELDEAIQLYKKALEKEPGFVEAWVNMSACYRTKKEYEKALSALDRAKVIAPENYIVWVNRAIILRLMGRYEDSIKDSLYVIRNFGNVESALLNLAFAFYESGKYKMGIYILKQITERFKENYIAHNLLGLIYEKLGYIADAEEEYKKAIQIKKNYYHALVNLARVELQLGKMDEAEDYVARAIRANPAGGEAHLIRGVIMRKRGKYDEAENEYRTAIRYLEDKSPAFYNLANLYEDYLNRPAPALKYLKKYLELVRDSASPEHIKEVEKRIALLENFTSGKIKAKVPETEKAGEGEEGGVSK